jgi:hypothetical protein
MNPNKLNCKGGMLLLFLLLLFRIGDGGVPKFVRRPPPPIIDADCSRTLSREAVSIINADILPLAKQFSVSPSLSTCELLPERARFYPQEAQKRAPGSASSMGSLFGGSWVCGWCSKEFKNEWFLDWHFIRKHSVNDSALGPPPYQERGEGERNEEMNGNGADNSNNARSGATCLAHYCGMLGCPSVVFAPAPVDPSSDDDPAAGPEFRRPKGYVPPTPSSSRTPISAAAASADPLSEPAREAVANSAAVPRGNPHMHSNGVMHDPHAASRKDAVLSEMQQLERKRCTEVIDKCFPLPYPSDEDISTSSSSLKEDSSSQSNNKTLRRSVRAGTLLERTIEVRKQLSETFCESDTYVKRTREMDRSRNAANTSTRATMLIVVVCVGVLAAGVWFAIGFFHDGSKQRLAIERRNREGNENRNEGDGRSGFASGVVSGGGGESRYRKMIQ